MNNDKGILYPTCYTQDDILSIVDDYHTRTGQEPKKVIYRMGNDSSVNWLNEFGIATQSAKIQDGTILII